MNRQQKNTQPASPEDAIYEAEPGRVSAQHDTEEPLYEPTPTDSQPPAPGGASENTAVALYDYQAGESQSHSMCSHCVSAAVDSLQSQAVCIMV